jgi:hypothetical protein
MTAVVPTAARVERRPLPYPYRATLAVCSDLDETPGLELYTNTLRFLNTSGPTPFGEGLGLEVGNTMYFDMPAGQFSYWNTDDRGRATVRALMRSGHVDCLHSFGDLATTRAHAARALEDLDRHDCRLQVWVDHAVAPSNFGADIMHGFGDVSGAPAFHADLTWDYGVRFVWRGRVTSVTGQGVPRRVGGIFDARHAVQSGRTFAKEAAKGVLGRVARRYQAHATNELVRADTLRTGHAVQEFTRCNPHWGGVSRGETATGFGEVVRQDMLDRLVARGGACVLYTHLGKTITPSRPFTERGLDGWRRLARAHHDGLILVTTTRRLLGTWAAARALTWAAREDQGATVIDVQALGTRPSAGGAGDLDGLSFYVADPPRTRVIVDGAEVGRLRRNPPDHTGRPSVSIPWPRLEFPSL